MMKFGGIQKTSLIDFPDRISIVLFTVGCNLRCPFCHNWRLILEPKGPFISEEEVLQILKSRRKYVDSVVVTGGEPTIYTELPDFLKRLKEENFNVKLDTNGFFPQILEESLPYIDYVALDVKTSLEKYRLLGADNIKDYLSTIEMLKEGNKDYEFRTTVVPGFVTVDDLPKIGVLIKGAKRYVLQQFIPNDTLDKSFNYVKPYSAEKISEFAGIMKKYVEEIILRV